MVGQNPHIVEPDICHTAVPKIPHIEGSEIPRIAGRGTPHSVRASIPHTVGPGISHIGEPGMSSHAIWGMCSYIARNPRFPQLGSRDSSQCGSTFLILRDWTFLALWTDIPHTVGPEAFLTQWHCSIRHSSLCGNIHASHCGTGQSMQHDRVTKDKIYAKEDIVLI